MKKIIGREREQKLLKRLLDSDRAEFLALYGRRRVGKTYLIQSYFKKQGLYLEVTGLQGQPKSEQLKSFHEEFSSLFTGTEFTSVPKDWREAFHRLKEIVATIKNQKVIIFLDELPWLASPRSGLLPALDYYWNRHFSRMKNVVLVICGSAASWMIKKVINDKGGLYGRLSAEMRLLPFTLSEVEEYLLSQNITLTRKQITELYLAIGGIPKYLTHITKGQSTGQLINDLFFLPQGPLFTEFPRLYHSLFDESEKHLKIIRALSQKRTGITQKELLRTTGLPASGRSTEILVELEELGFITSLPQFGKTKRETIFRLVDEYSHFYLTWVEPIRSSILQDADPNYWNRQMKTSEYLSWAGYNFETICFKHIRQIKQSLGLGGITTTQSHWFARRSEEYPGAEVDLVIDRADNCINLCEMKFSSAPYHLSAKDVQDLERKREVFTAKTKTRKALFTTLITPYGAKKNAHYHQIISSELTLDDLF